VTIGGERRKSWRTRRRWRTRQGHRAAADASREELAGMRFIVALDGSEQALHGARLVASLPLDRDDEVLLASIVERPMFVGAWGHVRTPATAALYAQAWEQAQRDARCAVESAAAELAASECTVQRLVRDGHAVNGLIDLVRKTGPDVVVLGPHGRGRLESILLGSVTQSLLQAMPASVLVAREPVRTPRRVLLATDGSDHSLTGAAFLSRFPLPLDARIFVTTVVDVRHLPPLPHEDVAELVAQVQLGAAEINHRPADVLAGSGKSVTSCIRHGDPKWEILKMADELEADLIVTGARGIGGFRSLVLGSVSRAVSKAARCSTLVVAAPAGTTGRRDDG
jgi:nucleotide-binding universal stress UspA family protein